MAEETQLTVKLFFTKLLAGTAQGVLVAVLPNAILSGILKYISQYELVGMIINAAVIFQLATPIVIGSLIAQQFDFSGNKMLMVGGAALIGSGVMKSTPNVGLVGVGPGDIINTMITAAVAVVILLLIKEKLGSVSIIGLPIIAGVGGGVIGLLTYPTVSRLTVAIGKVISYFSEFQPLLMSVLIACSFAALIISPITTVGISLVIQLQGVTAGAAAMGIAATTIVLVINSWKVNKSGVTLAIALGGMKLMMPNVFRYPIILLPCLVTAIISSIPVTLFSIIGTPQSAGLGLIGLVGPLASFEGGLGIIPLLLCWLLIPIMAGLGTKYLFEKILKLYDSNLVFAYLV